MTKKQTIITAVFIALGLARFLFRGGWRFGPTNIEVIQSYQSQFEPIHRQIALIADQIDSAPPIEESTIGNLPIRPVLRFSSPAASNVARVAMVDLMTYQEFEHGSSAVTEEDLESHRFSLHDEDDFEYAISWMGEANPLSQSVWHTNGSELESKITAAMKIDYLLVGRSAPADRDEPEGQSNTWLLEGFLVHIESASVSARVSFRLPTDRGRVPDSPVFGDALVHALRNLLAERADIEWPTGGERDDDY